MLIDYCHNNMSEMECQEALEKYKKKFALYDFDICLYEYYRKKGSFSCSCSGGGFHFFSLIIISVDFGFRYGQLLVGGEGHTCERLSL